MTIFVGLAFGCASIVNAALMKGETKQSNSGSLFNFDIRGSRRRLQMDSGCPKDYSLLHCSDPSQIYEISCDWNTCLWNLSELDPNKPPTSCIGVSIDDPQTIGLIDPIRVCALWSLMYGEHKSVSPTLSCTLNPCILLFCCFRSIEQHLLFRLHY